MCKLTLKFKTSQINKSQQQIISVNLLIKIKMNKREQQLYISFFEELYEIQEATLLIKKNIAKSLGYNPVLLFELISAGNHSITINHMRDYLNNRIACNQRQLYEIFQRFDWSRQGFISLDDFLIEMTPFGEAPFNPRERKGTVTPEIEGQFLSLLAEYIERFRIVEVSRKEIDFIAPYNAFEQIDYMKTGLIGLGELRRFFDVNDFTINDFQLRLLLHALRRRCYLEVNLQVFCENLSPLEFGQYQAYAIQIRTHEQSEFLRRSRNQQETMRRSRIQSQKIDHQLQKEERRKRAELQRELELEQRINKQILDHEQQKDRYYRRAVLEEDKNIRWNVEAGNKILEEERMKNLLDRERNAQLSAIRTEENNQKQYLARSALKREEEIEASRRAKLYEEELALRNQIERDRELRKRQYIEDMQRSRRVYEEEMRLDRERAMREYELERIRASNVADTQYFYQSRRTPAESRKINRDYEEEYHRKLQNRIQNTWSGKRGIADTAERSFRY